MTNSHRVGTLTLGGMLITFGCLFLLRLFFPHLNYDYIFRLWPIILIFLGLEILAANFSKKQDKLIYDKTAIGLIIVLSFFTMGLAIVQLCLEYATYHITLY
jgi:hypothetical protein